MTHRRLCGVDRGRLNYRLWQYWDDSDAMRSQATAPAVMTEFTLWDHHYSGTDRCELGHRIRHHLTFRWAVVPDANDFVCRIECRGPQPLLRLPRPYCLHQDSTCSRCGIRQIHLIRCSNFLLENSCKDADGDSQKIQFQRVHGALMSKRDQRSMLPCREERTRALLHVIWSSTHVARSCTQPATQ